MILVRDKKNFELGGEKTVNDKWMEAGFMLIQQVAHLAKYQTLKEMESCGLKPNQEYWLCCEVKVDYPKKSLLSAWE